MIKTVVGDITKIKADVVVNAANGQGIMGAGVAGAIARAGGPAINKSAREMALKYGPFKAGQSFRSDPGLLAQNGVKYIFHAVTMTHPGGSTSYDLVAQCFDATLQRTFDLNTDDINNTSRIQSIAVPALGTGVGGLKLMSVTEILVDTAQKFNREWDDQLEIIFVGDQTFVSLVNEVINDRRTSKS